MLGKWLNKARAWLRPASRETASSEEQEATPSASQQTPLMQNVDPAPSSASPREDALPEAPETTSPEKKEQEVTFHLSPNRFTYRDGDFQFETPLTQDEYEVVKAAVTQYQEMKEKYGDNPNNWEQQLLKHYEAKQYWALQIYFKDRAQACYKRRDEDTQALQEAITYCQKQIAYAPMAIHAHELDPQTKDSLPQHYGYKQLSIIYDREGRYDEAIQLCEQALTEGWSGDWEKRIVRYKKNRKKAAASATG
jgi:tetratricopeptide (TPR) repeat protein